MQEFSIFELPVGRGIIALCPMPGRAGDYAVDLATILAWAPDLTISMVESFELAGPLSADLSAAGGIWIQVPVVDFDVPAGDTDWAIATAQIGIALENGGRVLVHCMGGCGRSGMAVLRVMIAAGEQPNAALARLRDVRPCAVETGAQMIWAKRA